MSDDAFERDLNAVRAALDRGSHASDIETVVPVIVPREFFASGHWVGPHLDLAHPDLGLTWTILQHGQAMTYVSHQRVELWESEHVDWRARAEANLMALSQAGLWTHERRDANGNIVFVAMMHPDGLGSSRVLLGDVIQRELGQDVLIGIPDRSCAIVFPASVTRVDERTPAEMVRQMFLGATSPLCGDLLRCQDLRAVDAESAG